MRSSYASSDSSSSSHRSTGSGTTYSTNVTAYSDLRPPVHRYESAPSNLEDHKAYPSVFENETQHDSPRTSVETYASTVSSKEDLADIPRYELPQERHRIYESDALATTPPDFAKLFPTTRRLLIQHDDSTSDGNMNIRVDTEALSQDGDRLKMTLFHLRMKNLHERQFSLRRYCRESGREICSTKKKYVKPVPRVQPRNRPSITRSLTTALQNIGVKTPRRQDSGYESDDAEELEDELRNFTLTAEVAATIPTNIIRLEYSNYAQVELHRHRQGHAKQWDFSYWAEPYSWRRELSYDEDEAVYSYELISLRTGDCIAYVMPDKLDDRQKATEQEQGAWLPPSSMRLTDRTISEDLADVIVSTGLTVVADDCIKRRWHNSKSIRVHVPEASSAEYQQADDIVETVFPRHN